MRVARLLDHAGHLLYAPAAGGNLAVRERWYHHVHLIPGALLGVVCDRYDRALGVTEYEMYRTR